MNTLAGKLDNRGIEWVPVLFGLAAMYVPTLVDLFMGLWRSDEQMHGPIILAVCLYLFWSLRHDIQNAPVAPRRAIAWPLFAFGLIFYILGRSQDIILFELGSLLWILPALLLMQRGTKALKACWFPIFFLLFMIPLPSAIVSMLTMPMKTFVSWATEHVLYAFGYPISRNGVILYLGQYQLLVADACAGLHTLFSLEAMGLFYLHLTRHESWGRNTALAILIIPISLTANTIRVMTLSLITYHFGDEAGQGFLHGFAGMVLFISALILIMALDSLIQFVISKRKGSEKVSPTSTAPKLSPDHIPLPLATIDMLKKWGTGIGLGLIAAVASAYLLTPKPIPVSDHPDLEAMVPKKFGNWTIDPGIIPVLPSPDQQAAISETYDKLVNRTYVNNADGKRMMVSIAYGSRQDQKLKAHRQEVCYAAQGFDIKNIKHVTANVAGTDITVTRMFAVAKQRQEPVTYWFTVGNQVVQSHIDRFLIQMQYGLSGTIPDGVLVRISNLNSNEQLAYQEHLDFINEMISNIPKENRSRFVGTIR